MNNVSNGLLAAMLLCSFMVSANAADPSKEVDGRRAAVVITDQQNDFQSLIVPWGIASRVVSKDATSNKTRNIASPFNLAKRKDAFNLTVFENPDADRLVSYRPYFQDGKIVTNPHKVHHWRLIRW